MERLIWGTKVRVKSIGIAFCVLACAFLILLPIVMDGAIYRTNPAIPLDGGWTVFADGVLEGENASLPYSTNSPDTRIIDLYLTLPEKYYSYEAVSFVSFQKNVTAYVDGELVYTHMFEPSGLNKKTPGSGTVVFELPHDSTGKELHIRLERIVDADTSPASLISLIDSAANAVTSHIPSLLMATIMASLTFIGITMVIICFSYRKLNINLVPMLCLSYLILSISMWTLCNSKAIELFTNNWQLAHNIEYISFYALPLSIWMYIKYNWESKTRIPHIMTNVMFSFFALSLALKCFAQIDFFVLLRPFHALVLLNMPIFIYELVKNCKKQPESYRLLCGGLTVVLLSGVIELARYYNTSGTNAAATLFIWGTVAMAVMFILSFILSTKESIDLSFDIESMKNIEAEHRRYEAIVRHTQNIFFDMDIKSELVYYSESFFRYFGENTPVADMRGQPSGGKPYISYDRSPAEVFELAVSGAREEKLCGNFTGNDGQQHWFEVNMTTVMDAQGEPGHIIGTVRDLTSNKNLENELSKQSEYLQINRDIYDNVLEADITRNIITGDNAETLAETLGLGKHPRYDDLIAAICKDLTHEDYREEYAEMLSCARILSLFESGVPFFNYECMEKSIGGEFRWIRLHVRIFKSEITGTVRIISYIKDVHEEKSREFELLTNSRIDSLSGLYNKGATKSQIDAFLQSCLPGAGHTLIMIDIDNFKCINDTLGHAVGDTVIADVGKKLKTYFRESDVVGRVGGDEFAILMKNVSNLAVVHSKCNELCREFEYEYAQGDKSAHISLSIGVCRYPDDGTNYDMLYQHADEGLYSSKRKGRNTYSFYEICPKEGL